MLAEAAFKCFQFPGLKAKEAVMVSSLPELRANAMRATSFRANLRNTLYIALAIAFLVLLAVYPREARGQLVSVTVPKGTRVEVFTSTDADKKAQTVKQAEHGYAFLKKGVGQAVLIAALRSGDTTLLRATPEQFMKATLLGSEQSFTTREGFALWLSRLEVVPCGNGKVRMGRIMEPSGVMKLDYWREFRKGEECLRDNNSGLLILSLMCGNPIDNTEQIAKDKESKKAKPNADSANAANAFIGAVIGLDPSQKKDTIEVHVSGKVELVITDTTKREAFVKERPAGVLKPEPVAETKKAPATVVIKRDRTGWYVAGGLILGAAIYCAIECGKTKEVHIPRDGSGGPVNAPNGLVRPTNGWSFALRFP